MEQGGHSYKCSMHNTNFNNSFSDKFSSHFSNHEVSETINDVHAHAFYNTNAGHSAETVALSDRVVSCRAVSKFVGKKDIWVGAVPRQTQVVFAVNDHHAHRRVHYRNLLA